MGFDSGLTSSRGSSYFCAEKTETLTQTQKREEEQSKGNSSAFSDAFDLKVIGGKGGGRGPNEGS